MSTMKYFNVGIQAARTPWEALRQSASLPGKADIARISDVVRGQRIRSIRKSAQAVSIEFDSGLAILVDASDQRILICLQNCAGPLPADELADVTELDCQNPHRGIGPYSWPRSQALESLVGTEMSYLSLHPDRIVLYTTDQQIVYFAIELREDGRTPFLFWSHDQDSSAFSGIYGR